CPDEDDDGDGVPDVRDGCPLEPEDKDGFQDGDGCPEPDNDGDGVPDAVDGPVNPNDPNDPSGLGSCRDEPETVNGYEDEDGCPDVKKAELSETEITLYETVHFETDQATLVAESHDL